MIRSLYPLWISPRSILSAFSFSSRSSISCSIFVTIFPISSLISFTLSSAAAFSCCSPPRTAAARLLFSSPSFVSVAADSFHFPAPSPPSYSGGICSVSSFPLSSCSKASFTNSHRIRSSLFAARKRTSSSAGITTSSSVSLHRSSISI